LTDLHEQFLELMRPAREARMRALDRAIFDALRDGKDDDLPALRADYRAERDRLEQIAGEAREELIAQWPTHYPPLPLWFADPAAAAADDPPGDPCVVDLAARPDDDSEALAPDFEAQILATRAAKAVAEDELRATGTVPVALNTGREAAAEDLGL